MDIYTSLNDACLAVGVRPPAAVPERRGVWIPQPLINKSRSNDSGRVLLFADGKGGIVHNWAINTRAFFFYEGWPSNAKEQKAMYDRIKTVQANCIDQQKKRYALAAEKAQVIFDHSFFESHGRGKCVNPSMYLEKKGLDEVLSWGLRHNDAETINEQVGYTVHGTKGGQLSGKILVIPITDVRREKICSLQFIDDAGNKAFLAGGQISGRAALVPYPEQMAVLSRIGIAEGVATAFSVTKLFGLPCIAALSCNNLKKVACNLRQAYPWLTIDIYGDVGNGSKDAEAAADAVFGHCYFPDFNEVNRPDLATFIHMCGEPTDWNDYGIITGWRTSCRQSA